MTYQILVVDDEKTFRHFLSLNLQEQGYTVTQAADGQSAMKLINENSFDVALIDLRLTDMDGLDIMRHLRQVAPQTSVIILTGHGTLVSAIEALRQGAHDYVIKPFEPRGLLASVADGIARRSTELFRLNRQQTQESVLQVKDLILNQASRQISRNGEVINLTPTEFDILSTLMACPNIAIDAVTLIKKVRGYEATEADARAIARVHMHRLRHKLEADLSNPQYIITVAGGRYLMSDK